MTEQLIEIRRDGEAAVDMHPSPAGMRVGTLGQKDRENTGTKRTRVTERGGENGASSSLLSGQEERGHL